jgi:hypothetical protein
MAKPGLQSYLDQILTLNVRDLTARRIYQVMREGGLG